MLANLAIIPGFLNAQLDVADDAETHYYQNPVISGFHPDPSICRVGDDYYLVTSTFEYFPGVPVYHSKDLVNWKIIGHALHRPSQLNLDGLQCSKGIFAPTIRYHEGTFYVITTLQSGYNNFVVTAKDPGGPWSEPHWIEGATGIDPSLFFDDDGKVYYTGNRHPDKKIFQKDRNIWLQELDTESWELVGKRVDIIKAADDFNGLILTGQENTSLNNYEAPHLYKKDGIYYMMLAHGGTSWNHAESIWKSDNIWGPYEMNVDNPILTHREFPQYNEIHCTGHADVIQTQNDEWWMVLLATRPYGGAFYNLGRETFLVPVNWSGEWPVVNPEGPQKRVSIFHKRPDLPSHPWPEKDKRDDFTSDKLDLNFNFIRTPRGDWWSLNEPESYLSLDLIPEDITQQVNPAFIGRRQQHKNLTAITRMEFTPESENETAGLVILRDTDYQFRLVYTLKDNEKMLQLIRRSKIDGDEKIISEEPVDAKSLELKIEACLQEYSFSYSLDGSNWNMLKSKIDGRILSRKWAGGFTGIYIGMYASANGGNSTNKALFDWFEYSGF